MVAHDGRLPWGRYQELLHAPSVVLRTPEVDAVLKEIARKRTEAAEAEYEARQARWRKNLAAYRAAHPMDPIRECLPLFTGRGETWSEKSSMDRMNTPELTVEEWCSEWNPDTQPDDFEAPE